MKYKDLIQFESVDEIIKFDKLSDDNYRDRLVKTFVCSTGLHNTTPRGIFLDGFPVNRWHYFQKFNCWAQYSFEVTGDIMFHSVIYSSDNENSLRSGSLYALGNPASHGCIRLTVEDAKWVYDNVGAGTVVSIREDLPADPELRDALKLPPLDKKYCTPVSTPVPTAEPEYSLDQKPELGKRQLTERSEGPEVYWVQQTLKNLGYYDTKCTGKMLGKTVKAVKAFQKDHGLKANGGVTQELIDLLAETAKDSPET